LKSINSGYGILRIRHVARNDSAIIWKTKQTAVVTLLNGDCWKIRLEKREIQNIN